MIKNIFSSVLILLVLASCSKTNVKITGDIKEAGKQRVYLEQLNVDNAVTIDSTETNNNGHFAFKTNVELPTFFNVKIGPKESITFIAEPNDEIELSGTFKGLSQNYWVDGSENSLWVKLLNFQLNNTQVAMDSLKKAYTALPQDETTAAERQRLLVAWDSVINRQVSFSKDFILKHAISPASYYALYQKFNNTDFILTPETDLHSYKVVASSLKAMYPESQYTQAILKHLSQINKNIQNARIRQLIDNTESTLPAIRLANVKGDTIALSSLKGKYIILDFTILATKESEAYIKEMKNIYNKFKNRGVQIYMVCLDENKPLWERIVKQDNIEWPCVIDPDGLKSRVAKLWNIQTIPANYIINPKSEIVGKNLTGRRLEERLNDLLK